MWTRAGCILIEDGRAARVERHGCTSPGGGVDAPGSPEQEMLEELDRLPMDNVVPRGITRWVLRSAGQGAPGGRL
jgi:hypothetical protein